MTAKENNVESIYVERIERLTEAMVRHARRERWVMNLRVAAFVVAVGAFIFGWNSPYGALWKTFGAVALCGFAVLVQCHERIRRQLQRDGTLKLINQQAIARLRRDWAAMPETRVAVPAEHRATADDLDLFGHASLFQFANQTETPFGIRTLRDWLLKPAMPEEIERRQRSAEELASHLDLRQTLALEGRLLSDRGRAMDRFADWAEGGPWLAARPVLLWWCRGMAAAVAMIFVLAFCQVLSGSTVFLIFLAAVCVNVATIVLFGGKVHDIIESLRLQRGEASRLLRMFELMYSMPDASAELDAVKREATGLGGGVLLRFRQLRQIAWVATIRHNGFLTIFVYLPLALMFLYDFHALNLLERWQSNYGRFVRRWFEALGKFESLCSLAAIVHDFPAWKMPKVEATADRLRGVKLGHPLLPEQVCVRNDVEIGPADSFLLVTGSNMSGKSTLLRAVGVNAVLAQAGSPVCAEGLSMPPVVPATSMRIRDSLEAGVSFYMAELVRLKEIVDLARRTDPRNGRKLLYLLDEILLGTNSKERHIAVVRVLRHLLHCGAIGAVSTHDLDLASTEPLAAACRPVHFRETLHGRDAEKPMTFDYQLHPGIATTTNALKLLEIVGLSEE
jgi:hypothetical protein